MDKYIATAITLILLFCFVPQSALQTTNHARISKCEAVVEVAKEEAKQEGYFTDEIINEMNASFTALGIDVSEVTENLTTSVKYRANSFNDTELIEYEIGIPIKQIVATPMLWGISDADNEYMYYFKGAIPSERVLR